MAQTIISLTNIAVPAKTVIIRDLSDCAIPTASTVDVSDTNLYAEIKWSRDLYTAIVNDEIFININGVDLSKVDSLAYMADLNIPEDLEGTLNVGNTTGANDISIDAGQSIVSGNGTARIALDDGAPQAITISTGAGATTQADLYVDDGYMEMTISGGANGGIGLYENFPGIYDITLSTNTSGTLELKSNNIVFKNVPGGLDYIWNTSNLAGGNKTLTLQNASGTIAYLSDITAAIPDTFYSADGSITGNRTVTGDESLWLFDQTNFRVVTGDASIIEAIDDIITLGAQEVHLDTNILRILGVPGFDTSSIEFRDLGATPFNGLLQNADLTAARTWILPNNTGTIVLDTDISTFISNVVEDLTPQLGGNLDVNGNEIVGTNVSIDVTAGVQIELGDDAGVNKFSIRDTDPVEVFAVDSNGNVTLAGTVDGIDVGTDVAVNNLKVSNVTTNLSIGTKTGTTLDVNSSDGTNATVPAVTITEAGVMTAADKVKLDGIEAGAQVSNHLGTFAADPVVPAAGGETYFNSTINSTMVYDLSRTKWLSIANIMYGFSRNGNTAAGSYFNMTGGILMTPTVTGYPTAVNATLVTIQISRTDLDAVTIEVAADGVAVGEITLGANVTSGTAILNADITHPAILTTRVKSGTNTVTDCAGTFAIKLRV